MGLVPLGQGLRGLVEFLEAGAELGEALGAESFGPAGFHFGDRLADDDYGFGSAWGETDAFGASVLGVGFALQVAALLELPE